MAAPDWLSRLFQQLTIRNGAGADMNSRSHIKFIGPAVSDDAANDQTIVDTTGGGVTLAGDTVGPSGTNTVQTLTGNGGVVSLVAAALVWAAGAVSPSISQAQSTSGGAAQNMSVSAQAAKAGSAAAGGNLILSSGLGDGAGANGDVIIRNGGTEAARWTAGTLQIAAGIATPTIKQAISTAGAGVALLISAQDAKAGSAANGGDLKLQGGAKDGAGANGNVVLPRITTAGLATLSASGVVGVLANGTNTFLLTMVGGSPAWAAAPTSGITQLTGEVTAGPGSGSVATVVAGNFSTASLLWANTVAAATLGTNVAAATLTVACDANVKTLVFDVAGGTSLRTTFYSPNGTNVAAITANNSSAWSLTTASGSLDFTATSVQAELQLNATTQLFANAGNILNWAGTNKFLRWSNSGLTVTLGDAALTALVASPNAQLCTGTGSFGSGTGVLGITNATVVPTTNPSGGGIMYASGGALYWRGSSGTVTTIALA